MPKITNHYYRLRPGQKVNFGIDPTGQLPHWLIQPIIDGIGKDIKYKWNDGGDSFTTNK